MSDNQIDIPVADPLALLKVLLASSRDCIKILDLAGGLLFMTEGGQRVMEVPDFEIIRGCPWPDFWQDEGHEQAKAALQSARAGGTGHFFGTAKTMGGTLKWWEVTVTPIPDAGGKPDRLLAVSRDVSTAYAVDAQLREKEARLAAALAAADIGTWDYDPRTGDLRWDDRCYALFGLTLGKEVNYQIFLNGLHPLDREATDRACMDAMRFDGPQSYDIEYRTIGLEDGVERWCSAKGKAFFQDGKPFRFIGTIRDVGDLKRAQRQRELLTHELEHRLKNTMAMVGAIANQTFRTADTKEIAAAIFDQRLIALNRAHDLLTRTSWSGATMTSVVRSALEPHQTADRRISIEGPDVDLTAKQALSLALALHELATNAAKYGALSNQDGTVDVKWDVSCGLDGALTLQFRWDEIGGPPVAEPKRRGFGTRLIQNTLSNDFGRDVRINYPPTGLNCSFDCSMSYLASGS